MEKLSAFENVELLATTERKKKLKFLQVSVALASEIVSCLMLFMSVHL